MNCDVTGLSDLRKEFETQARAHSALPGIIKFFTNSDAEAEDYTRYAGMVADAEQRHAKKESGVLSTLYMIREEFNLKKRDLGDTGGIFDFGAGTPANSGPAAEYDRFIKKIDCVVNSLAP